MALPQVAIVGRPNVGKSTLFNRLLRQRRAVVEEVPGTTRDRIYGVVDWNGLRFGLFDTGGLLTDEEIARSSERELLEATKAQAEMAVREADVIVFVVDAASGLTASDWEVAEFLRRTDKPIVLAANKAESRERELNALQFYEFGLGEPIPISALHGKGIPDLLEAIAERLPRREEVETLEPEAPKIAMVGRPNVGKSALLNAILGQPRQIVSPIPGTTRDTVDTELVWKGQPIVLIDTAGIRRPGRIERDIERYSVLRAERAIERADVAVLVIDANEPFTHQDQAVAGKVIDAKKGIVVVVNKWDLFEHMEGAREAFEEDARAVFHFMPWAPLVFVSALTGKNVEQVVDLALVVVAERSRRIPTAELNQLLREAVAHHPPPTKPGKWVKFYYVTQAAVNPPTFVFFCNRPQLVHFSYKRYLENRIRERYSFLGTPIELVFRARERSAPAWERGGSSRR